MYAESMYNETFCRFLCMYRVSIYFIGMDSTNYASFAGLLFSWKDVSILLWTEESIVIPVAIWYLNEQETYGTTCAMALVQTTIIFGGILIFKLFVKGEIVEQA